MNQPAPSDDRLNQVLAEILKLRFSDESIDLEKIVGEYPEYAKEIRQFLADQRQVDLSATTQDFRAVDPNRSPRIGNFKLLQRLGEGGMGEVWMADQERPVRRRVAIKLVKPGMDSRAVLARFDAERQALALMNHPNIAKVFEAGIVSDSDEGVGVGRPYFVMELVKGIPITDFCDQRRLSIHERLELFRQACSAVHHAHQKGIIHRDLKPSNILVESHDDRPVLKIIDFGLAKAIGGTQLTEQTFFTALGTIAGTPLYMAPEQAVVNAIDIDIRADIYSLGVVLYELLTGSTPLTKDTLHQKGVDELLKLIRDYDPPKPSLRLSSSAGLPSIAAMRKVEPVRLGRFVRGELDWIAMKALSKERERRYGSAMAFSDDILRFLNKEPVQAGPPSSAYILRKFASRYRGIVLTTTTVMGALGMGLVGTTIGFLRAQHSATQERNALKVSQDARDEAIAAKNAAELEAYVANISLIQSALESHDYAIAKTRLNACSVNLRGFEWYLLERQANFIVSSLPESEKLADKFVYSFNDDESLVLAYLDEKTIQVFDLQGKALGSPLQHPSRINGAFFGHHSPVIITACADGNIRIWSSDSENASSLVIPTGTKNPRVQRLATPNRFVSYQIEDKKGCKLWDYRGNEITSDFLKTGRDLTFKQSSRMGTMLVQQGLARLCLIDSDGTLLGEMNTIANGTADFWGRIVVTKSQLTEVQPRHRVWSQDLGWIGEFSGSYSSPRAVSQNGKLILSAGWDLLLADGNGNYRPIQRLIQGDYDYSNDNQAQLALIQRARNSTNAKVMIWNENGEKVRESLSFYCQTNPRVYIKFCRDNSKLAVHSNTQHFKILDSTTLRPITFPMRGDLLASEFHSQPEFPLLAESGGDAGPNQELGVWSDTGVRLGQATVSPTQVRQLRLGRVGLIGNHVVDLMKFDNGISILDEGLAGRVEIDSLLESCNRTANTIQKHAGSFSVRLQPNEVELWQDSRCIGTS